jgi:hypothetical protein
MKHFSQHAGSNKDMYTQISENEYCQSEYGLKAYAC